MDPRLAERMTAHVEELAHDHKIRLRWVTGWRKAEAIPGVNAAVVPRIHNPSDYLFALHELGHCASPLSRRMVEHTAPYGNVICEGAAWAWAADAAKSSLAKHLTAKDWDRVGYAFRTYVRLGARKERTLDFRARLPKTPKR